MSLASEEPSLRVKGREAADMSQIAKQAFDAVLLEAAGLLWTDRRLPLS